MKFFVALFLHTFQKNPMKNLFTIIAASLMMIFINSCTSQNVLPSQKVTSLLQGGEFTFMAERANPTNFDVINVLSSLPGGGSSQILNLDYGYTLTLKKNEVVAVLPYFGRMFSPSFDNEKNSYRFTSKDFNITERMGKKGSMIYTIAPKDLQNVRAIILEVFKNGKAYLNIDGNDRQPISYDGYIMENPSPKKVD